MRSGLRVLALSAVVSIAGCGGTVGHSKSKALAVFQRPPVPVCSLLTAGEVSAVLRVHVRVQRSATSCTYQATRRQVFRAVVVTPQRLAFAPRVAFDPRVGPIARVAGPGYRGQAQNDAPSHNGPAPDQATAQVVSGNVSVRLFVTYQDPALRQVSQVRQAATLADKVGRRLVRLHARR